MISEDRKQRRSKGGNNGRLETLLGGEGRGCSFENNSSPTKCFGILSRLETEDLEALAYILR